MAAQVQMQTAAVDQILNPASRPSFRFAFDDFLRREYQFGADPSRPYCKAFLQGHCPLQNKCPERHGTASNPQFVCKHWLRGLCKKGDQCDYVHEYNMRGHAECPSYARHQTCANGDDCLLLHLDPDAKRPACPHYARGFCPLGPYCAHRHVRRARLCPFFLAGFCPSGRACAEGAHARFPTDLRKPEARLAKTPEQLEQERLDREAELQREEDLDRERDERSGASGGPSRDRFRGGWRNKRSGGPRRQKRGGF